MPVATPFPVPDAGAALTPVERAHAQTGFRRLVVAGDLFEREFLPDLYRQLRALLNGLGVEWIGLVPGNHDRAMIRHGAFIPLWPDGVCLGEWRVVHGDADAGIEKQVMGHWHPCVRIQGRKVPCYLASQRCLVLPAFSRDAAGADVSRQRRWDGFRRLAIVGEEVVAVAQ